MAAPLAEDYAPTNHWLDDVRWPTVEAQSPPAEADVVVIGSGYCGLSAAAELAALGRSVVVLDRDEIGSGASSRNGGMVIPELKPSPSELTRRYGPLGERLLDAIDEAFDHLEALITAEAIDCGYERTGQLYLAHNRAGADEVRHLAADYRATGREADAIEGEELAAEIRSDRFVAAMRYPRTGGLQPARLCAALTRRALAAGAALHPRTAATAIAEAPGGFTVRTDRGSIRAGDVLLATNGYPDAIEPWLRRRVLPMGSFIIATEPLEPELERALIPQRRMCFDTKNLLWYWRVFEGRMIFGGRRRLGSVELTDARDHLHRSMVAAHPDLAGTLVSRVWGGNVALTYDRMPHIGRVDGVWYATGCNGSGVALNTWMGHRLAHTIAGGGDPSPFAELDHPRIPLFGLRRFTLPLVSLWYQRKDARR